MIKDIGFIGLGNIGLPMALRLAASGPFQVTVSGHRRREPLEQMAAAGAKVAGTPREVAEASQVLISMVRDQPQTERVLFGEDGAWDGLSSGSTLILCSTLTPDYCQELEQRGKEKGVAVLDAPVSGMAKGAEAGTLTFFVGGSGDVVEECQPVFQAMGQNIFHLGRVGTGQVAKLSNNLLLFATIHGLGEAIRMVEKVGLGWQELLKTIQVSTGNCWAVQNWEYLGVIDRDPARVFDLVYKDLEAAMHFARHSGLRLPLAGLLAQMEVPPFP
jgi:3-hydroxyisobutyrate dehydrogenase-like beta-hydroxyacid dehydrogenase